SIPPIFSAAITISLPSSRDDGPQRGVGPRRAPSPDLIFNKSARSRRPRNVRYAPIATKFGQCGETSFSAKARHHRLWTASLGLDVRRLDDRPPLLDLCLLKSAKRFRRLLVTQRNFLTEVGKLLAHCRVG